MCLIVGKEEFKIETAQKDIVVYKILSKKNDFIISPYQGFVYEIGKKYKTRMKHFPIRTYCKITEGFHSFLKEEDAKSEKEWIELCNVRYTDWDLCCLRCIVPKGTNVVYGKYSGKDAIVSETIKVVEEVKL